VINDKSHGNITKHLECNVLPYYKLIIQFAGEKTLKICEHLAKLQKKMVDAPHLPWVFSSKILDSPDK